ncbi:hypothetical protein niasHS_001368 [Heterodera schachtii]|uniref:Uncharacterized protein n=1 Tax=Heterodera schachtii TaxID=97005 RepID=A0ABD2KLP2_HETSC
MFLCELVRAGQPCLREFTTADRRMAHQARVHTALERMSPYACKSVLRENGDELVMYRLATLLSDYFCHGLKCLDIFIVAANSMSSYPKIGTPSVRTKEEKDTIDAFVSTYTNIVGSLFEQIIGQHIEKNTSAQFRQFESKKFDECIAHGCHYRLVFEEGVARVESLKIFLCLRIVQLLAEKAKIQLSELLATDDQQKVQLLKTFAIDALVMVYVKTVSKSFVSPRKEVELFESDSGDIDLRGPQYLMDIFEFLIRCLLNEDNESLRETAHKGIIKIFIGHSRPEHSVYIAMELTFPIESMPLC